jgi:hypothetical protein
LATIETLNTRIIDVGERLWGCDRVGVTEIELMARSGYAGLAHRCDDAGKGFDVAIDRSPSGRILRLENSEDFCPRRRGVGLKPQR